MNRHTQMINDRYEAMMFAKTRGDALRAARELVKIVLGDDGSELPLEDSLRQCCRVLRPSQDPREQQRFEAEFLELGIWPNSAQKIAA
ncbi:MAG: hypothetical protein JO210_08955 [Acidobacteriaceae bacterium]|nr:hypothetical protein [Acidobacteriaceae bacterium]